MPFSLLQKDIQAFIKSNADAELVKLALQKNPFPDVEWRLIIEQVACLQKAKDKLPTWFNTDDIIYPSKISIEQTSSEKTALYKSTLISGKTIIDLTGGFGVDDYYFSKHFESVVHCEMNEELSKGDIVLREVQLDFFCAVDHAVPGLRRIRFKFEVLLNFPL